MVQLGSTVTDKITGLTGIVTGRVEYLTGCNQCLVQPKARNREYKESHWFDEQRLRVEKKELVVLENANSPGADKEAPRR